MELWSLEVHAKHNQHVETKCDEVVTTATGIDVSSMNEEYIFTHTCGEV